jgi:hypothetical protein
MTYEVPDAWKLTSGLNDPTDFAIHSAYFSTSADYQNGQALLLFLIGTDEAGQPVEIRMPVGKEWITADAGKTITHAKKVHVQGNSIYGNWIQHAMDCEEVVNGQRARDILFARGNPTISDIWLGLCFHLDPVDISFGPKIDPVERLLPTHFLGLWDDNTQTMPGPQTGLAQPRNVQLPASAVPPAPVPSAPVPTQPSLPTQPPSATLPKTPQQLVAEARASQATNNGQSPLFQEMLTLAQASPTHAEFMAAAFSRPDVVADDELAVQVADDNAIWALAHPA